MKILKYPGYLFLLLIILTNSCECNSDEPPPHWTFISNCTQIDPVDKSFTIEIKGVFDHNHDKVLGEQKVYLELYFNTYLNSVSQVSLDSCSYSKDLYVSPSKKVIDLNSNGGATYVTAPRTFVDEKDELKIMFGLNVNAYTNNNPYIVNTGNLKLKHDSDEFQAITLYYSDKDHHL